jgi:tetratricopeptide (TPR) repeat protein
MRLFNFIAILLLVLPYSIIAQDKGYDDIVKELQQKNYLKAISICEKNLKENPKDSKLYAYLSYIYFTVSERKHVEVDKDALRQRGIREGQTYYFKENEDIRKFLTVKIGYDYDTVKLAETNILKAINLRQNLLEYYTSLAQIYYAIGNHSNLIQLIDSITIKFPDKNIAKAISKFGLNYFNSKKYDQALDIYKIVRKKFMNYLPAYSDAGTIFILQGKTDSAIVFLKEAHKIDPTDSLTIQGLSQLYTYLQLFDSAAVYKNMILKKDPENLETILDLGFLYSTFDNKKAVVFFDAFLDKIQNKKELNNWTQLVSQMNNELKDNVEEPIRNLNRSEELNRTGYPNYSIILLSRVLKVDSLNSPACFDMALLYRNNNMHSKAIGYLSKCEELSSNLRSTREVMAMIFLEKAKTYFLVKDYSNVLKYSQLCLEKYKKNSSEVHYLIGLSLLNQIKLTEAFREFNESVKINDNPKIVQQAKIEIDNLLKN